MRIELTDFINGVYENYDTNRSEGVGRAIWGDSQLSVSIPLYRGDVHVDNFPLSAFMFLAELHSKGGSAKVSELFSDVDLPGYADGFINATLVVLTNRGLVTTDGPTTPVVLKEENGYQLIQNPDGSIFSRSPDGKTTGISIGAAPTESMSATYRLNDMSRYQVELGVGSKTSEETVK